jgi:hypothetical protein
MFLLNRYALLAKLLEGLILLILDEVAMISAENFYFIEREVYNYSLLKLFLTFTIYYLVFNVDTFNIM